MDREQFMALALDLARQAAESGEVPVGCIIVDADGKVIGKGCNTREETRSALGHAELTAIDEACKFLGDWRLTDCTLYVTLEPCPMCAGAMINARIGTIVYGAKEENFGSCGFIINLFSENYGHKPAIFGGVLAKECAEILKSFFSKKR